MSGRARTGRSISRIVLLRSRADRWCVVFSVSLRRRVPRRCGGPGAASDGRRAFSHASRSAAGHTGVPHRRLWAPPASFLRGAQLHCGICPSIPILGFSPSIPALLLRRVPRGLHPISRRPRGDSGSAATRLPARLRRLPVRLRPFSRARRSSRHSRGLPRPPLRLSPEADAPTPRGPRSLRGRSRPRGSPTWRCPRDRGPRPRRPEHGA